jgi:glycerol uptake facilitator-like aquaporin
MDTDTPSPRTAFLVELLGSFGFVFVVAGVVCVNQVAQPAETLSAGQAHLFAHQPGLVGIALAQGLMLAALLSVTLWVSPGCLNPAIVLMNWVMGRLATARMAALLAAELIGGVLAGACLRYSFTEEVLRSAHLGTPHWSTLAYGPMTRTGLVTGTLIELGLTFFLVLAILCALRDGPRTAAWTGGVALAALTLIGFPLTGAALNPARWFGTVFWEFTLPNPEGGSFPLADVFVYAAGPVLGALLAGIVHARLLAPAQDAAEASRTAESSKAIRVKK